MLLFLRRRLSSVPGLRVPAPRRTSEHAYYKFYAFVVPEELAEGWDRDRIAQTIAAQGVPCGTGSCSEDLFGKSVSFPLAPPPPAAGCS